MKPLVLVILVFLMLLSGIFTGCDYITGQLPSTSVIETKPSITRYGRPDPTPEPELTIKILPSMAITSPESYNNTVGFVIATKPDFINAENITEIDDYEKIIPLLLSSLHRTDGYVIVKPEFNMSYAGGFIAALTEHWSSEKLITKIKESGYDVSTLLKKLFESNNSTSRRRMGIPSSIELGYLIDYGQQFIKYFGPDTDGWKNFRAANPKGKAYFSISLPVYDPNTKIVLVYISSAGDWLAASGDICAFKYENGKLEEIARINIWIS
jgi:hypothetical protein